MLEFFLNGGVPMFGVVVCGMAALVAAVRFVIAPDRRKVGAISELGVAALGARGTKQGDPVQAGHEHVAQHDRGPELLDLSQPFIAVVRLSDLVALIGEDDPERVERDDIIVNDEQPGRQRG